MINILLYQIFKNFKLSDGSYSISDIQDYLKYIIKKREAVAENLSKIIYVNHMEDRITLRIKTGYYLKLLMVKTIELLGNTKR